MTKNVVMVRNTDIQTYKCPHCQEYVKLDRIEIDSVMCDSIKVHNCFVKDNGRLSRITKLKRLVQNINNNNEFPAVCVVPIRLYTRPVDRKNGIQNYKYQIKSGRNLVAASILTGKTHVPCNFQN
ncbi:unnamed protein product [marine sediment metagenome]|uniref:Uncharacterized protein n=1 Tax=marine sediment metagenome TaxID=412755 RepID=X0WK43_9ZZZZ